MEPYGEVPINMGLPLYLQLVMLRQSDKHRRQTQLQLGLKFHLFTSQTLELCLHALLLAVPGSP